MKCSLDDRKNYRKQVKKLNLKNELNIYLDKGINLTKRLEELACDHSEMWLDEDTYVDMIYKIDRYKMHQSPFCIYIPCKDVMFKLMRACIGCTRKEDLWIWPDEEEE